MPKTIVNNPAGGFAEVEHDDNSVPMFSPDGKVYVVPKTNETLALQNGWNRAQSGAPKPTPEELTPEEQLAPAETQVPKSPLADDPEAQKAIQSLVQDNEDHRVVEGLKRFGNEALFGLPQMISDWSASPRDRQIQQEARARIAEAHPLENTIETGAGTVASLFTGSGEVGLLEKGAALGEKALAGGAERVGEAFLGREAVAGGTELTQKELAQGAYKAAQEAPQLTEGTGRAAQEWLGDIPAAEGVKVKPGNTPENIDKFFTDVYKPQNPTEAHFAEPWGLEDMGIPGQGSAGPSSTAIDVAWKPGSKEWWSKTLNEDGKQVFGDNMKELNDLFQTKQELNGVALDYIANNLGSNILNGARIGAITAIPAASIQAMQGDWSEAFGTMALGAGLGALGGGLVTAGKGAVGWATGNAFIKEAIVDRLKKVGVTVEGFADMGAKKATSHYAKAAYSWFYDAAKATGVPHEVASAFASTATSKVASDMYHSLVTTIGSSLWEHASQTITPLFEKLGSTLDGALKAEYKVAWKEGLDGVVSAAKSAAEDVGTFAKEKAGQAKQAYRKYTMDLPDMTKTASSVVADTATAAGPSTMRKIAGEAAKYGAQGALYSAADASQQAFNGDPEAAAETMLWGIGLNGILGAAVGGAGALKSKLAAGIGGAGTGVLKPALAAIGAHGAAAMAGGALGGTFGGIPGLFAGAAAGHFAEKAISNFVESPAMGALTGNVKKALQDTALHKYIGGFMAKSGTDAAEAHMNTIRRYLKGSQLASVTVAKLNPYAHITGESAVGLTKTQQYNKLVQTITNACADPNATAQKVGEVASVFTGSSVNLGQAVAAQHMKALAYLYNAIPRNPNAAKPFVKDTWKASASQMADFMKRAEIVNNPMTVWRHYEEGTLGKVDREVLQAVYPKHYQQMVQKIMQVAYSPDAPDMSLEQKLSLSLFTAQPLDTSLQNVGAIQTAIATKPVAAAPPQGASGGTRMPRAASKATRADSTLTDTQRRSYGSGK